MPTATQYMGHGHDHFCSYLESKVVVDEKVRALDIAVHVLIVVDVRQNF